jgi:hypothetical protein
MSRRGCRLGFAARPFFAACRAQIARIDTQI